MKFFRAFIVSTCALAGLGIIFTSTQKARAATLIHEYEFNGNANDSVGSINGTLNGGATASGGVLSLDGVSGNVQLSGFAIPTGAFSIAFDARSLGQTGFTEIISQGFSGEPGFYIGTDSTGQQFRLGDQFASTGVNVPSDGQLHSYAFESGSGGTNFYIDSSLVFSSVIGIIVPTSGTATRFGSQFNLGEFFKGDIEDIRIYSGELTTPLPAALPMFMGGLSLIGLLARRRKRKAQATA